MAVCNHQRHGSTSVLMFSTNPDDLPQANGAFYTRPARPLDVPLKSSGAAQTNTFDQVSNHRIL